jgi:hypothetical protein
VSRHNPEWRKEFQDILADLQEDDIAGSGFAITGYTVHQALGGTAALARLRVRQRVPDFCFMAEVYWDLEWTLQQQGFDYTYDKQRGRGDLAPASPTAPTALQTQYRIARWP